MSYTLTAQLQRDPKRRILQIIIWRDGQYLTERDCERTVRSGREYLERLSKRYPLNVDDLVNQILAQQPGLPPG